MFPKPAFGTNTTGFGSFNSSTTAASPFGSFKPTTGASTFGAPPAFGANATAQPATGGGLFGTTNTTGGLFGNAAAAPAPTFGNTSGAFGFGATTSGGGGLFANNTSTGLFAAPQNPTNAFGAKPAGFGFGSTATTATTGGGMFGSAPSTGTGLFGAQTNTMGGGGLFSNTTGAFGQQQNVAGTAHVKYNPVVGTDVVLKSGASQNINIKHHCITCMKEYENKSLEELRLEDYTAGRKGSTGGVFGGFQQQPTENKTLFGASTFGQPAATTASSVFGGGTLGGATGGFGQTSNTFAFGNNAQTATNTTGLFGAAKPTFGATTTPGTGLFGATTTQAPTFGTNTPSFGFGSNTQNQQNSLFGAKPATSNAFGAPAGISSFGSFGAGGGLFGAKPQGTAPAFGTNTPAFGTLGGGGGFGATTSSAGGLFSNTFNKPAATQPAFGFSAPNTSLVTGLGTGLGANTFQSKPAGPTFGTLGGGSSLFGPMQAAPNFSSGVDGGGLGGGSLFGNSSLGGTGLGYAANNQLAQNSSLSGASAAGNVHEQILNLVARPYGDSPLFKDLLPDTSTTAEDALKPTNPAAMKAILDSSRGGGYRVTSPNNLRLKVLPRPAATHDKKSLFDGLEESDASLEDKLTLKPSRKRLVLRQKVALDDHNELLDQQPQNRSLEEPPQRETNLSNERKKDSLNNEEERVTRSSGHGENNNLEVGTDKHGSWLGAFKHQWSGEKEKPVDNEQTPRLYPNLDKEMSVQISDRRASWLTTKPMRKPPTSNAEGVENSVRELGVRTERLSNDKENVDVSAVSEEEHVKPRDATPHPAGVKLARPGYYTIPSLDEMIWKPGGVIAPWLHRCRLQPGLFTTFIGKLSGYMRPDGSCVVPHLTIGRKNYGNVYYDCEMDVAGMDLDALVHFLAKEVTIYPDDGEKPPVGEGLNRRAIVTLDGIWPRDKSEKKLITDPERLLGMDYEGRLRRICDKHDTKFIEYRPQTGSWVFRVEHFSKYSLTDSDEEDDPTPEVMKRQLVTNQLQKAAPIAPPKPAQAGPGLGGLGGTSQPPQKSPLVAAGALWTDTSLFSMQLSATSLNLHGAAKAFEMDTTEDNTESQSLYHDSHRAYGVKSPTSELARLEHRHSHNVQLMKASLYADAELEDDVSVSTGEQLVPRVLDLAPPPFCTAPRSPSVVSEYTITRDLQSVITEEAPMKPLMVRPHTVVLKYHRKVPPVKHTIAEAPMKPLMVRPHTVVLKYHRKVPPFKHTIAGRLDAACIADMAVCRARHSRVGFGPANAMVYASTYDSVTDLPRSADLCNLGTYVRGRTEDDWSEPIVARLALGVVQNDGTVLEMLTRQLEILLEYSKSTRDGEDGCPWLTVPSSPSVLSAALRRLVATSASARTHKPQFGVSSSYCNEVFRLCKALWDADLENNGVPGTDDHSIVNRHKRFLEWLKTAVDDVTDEELAKQRLGDKEDETDGHSGRVWTLFLGGRVLEACKVARDNGELNMAALIAQSAGDPSFQSLVARQLSLWRECGADALISSSRLASLQLVGGLTSVKRELLDVDWLRALHATARYICPQVPSLEHVVRTYEGFFGGELDGDLSAVDGGVDDEMAMKYPLPPYMGDYDVTVCNNGKQHRVLDLRYELIRARALNTRPKLRPAAYTPDPMDYSLCFLLGCWFGNPTVESITGMSVQLEAAGAWHLAVLALCYHPDDKARGHLIREVLSRHAPARADTPELKSRLQLVRRLQVPEKWLLLAQAHRAKYERLPAVEAEHLIGAGQWNAAHKVLLEELLPEAVLADNLQSISPLLERLHAAAQRHEVSGWASGGQALHHYIHVCDEIRGLVSAAETTDRSIISSRLEALRPRVAAACLALGRLDPSTPRHAAARTEMGARLVQLALAAGDPPHHLAALVKALKLPPDCTASVQYKITTDLADQASELCIESRSSTPISSHHRATVQS